MALLRTGTGADAHIYKEREPLIIKLIKMKREREEDHDAMAENNTPPADAILYSAHTLAANECDMEKVYYAIKGMIQDVDRVHLKCDDKDCSQCGKEACDDHQMELLSVFLDAKQRYNLSDAEHIEAYMIAYDKTIGLPVQPINAGRIDSKGEMIIDEAFDANSEAIFNMVNDIYMQEDGDTDLADVMRGKDLADRTIGLDRAIEIAINETGISARDMIVYLLTYIRKQEDVLTAQAEIIRGHRKRKEG